MIEPIMALALAGGVASLPPPVVVAYESSPQLTDQPGNIDIAITDSLVAVNSSEGEVRLTHARELARLLGQAEKREAAAAMLKAEVARAGRAGVSANALAIARTELSATLLGLGRLVEARDLAAQAERELGASRRGAVEHVAAMLVLGRALNALGEMQAAEAMLKRAADAADAAKLPVLGAQVAEVQGGRALLRGDGVGAIKLYTSAIETLSERLGRNHVRIAAPLTGLANAYQLAGDFGRSANTFEQAIDIADGAPAERSNRVSAIRIEVARLMTSTGRFDAAANEAALAYDAIDTSTISGQALKGLAASARGFASIGLGDPKGARVLFEEGIAATIAARGAQSPDLPPGYIELARLDLAEARPAEAETHALAAETILDRQAPDAPLMAEARSLRAAALSAQGKHGAAVAAARSAAAILTRRSETLLGATSVSDAALREQVVRRGVYERLIDISYAANGAGKMGDAETFAAAQALHLGAASMSISQLVARHAAGSGPLSGLLTQRRALMEEWRAVETRLEDEQSGESIDPRSVAQLKAKRRQLVASAERLDAKLVAEYPEFAALMRPQPIDAAAIRAALRPGEAFLLHASTARATHLWLITRDQDSPYYARTVPNAEAVTLLAQRLRRSVTFRPDGLPPPFDARAAYELHQALLAPFTARLANMRTLIVTTDRQVHALPLAMLVVSDPGDGRDPTHFDFLVRHQIATAWTPSPGSFVALRSLTAPPPDLRPFFGVGDPVLLGEAGRQSVALSRILDRLRVRVDPDDLRQLEPIDNAGPQLRALATLFDAQEDDLLIGPRATETRLKAAELHRYRTLAFATHGLIAGRFSHLAEPGLVLTPPARASAIDDGLLTASEISLLSLNADWVILSACDTAAADGAFAGEGLSGLARAFYFAGARSLLVSGWPLKSGAAERLTTDTVRARGLDEKIGKAEALRRSMLALVEGRDWIYRHPALWASFMLAGEPN